MSFHNRTGKRIELKNQGKTALRNVNEFNHGIVLSKHPLIDDVSSFFVELISLDFSFIFFYYSGEV